MKSAFNKEIVRSITQSIGRFAAIAIISLLGAGFYAGLRMAAPDMRIAGDEFFDASNLFDISVVSTLGLDDDSLDALGSIQGVGQVMGSYQVDALVYDDQGSYVARIESFPAEAARESDSSDGVHAYSDDPSYLNRLILMQGEWPSDASECVVSADAAVDLDLSLGEVLEVGKTAESAEGSAEDIFEHTSFAISGFVNSAAYASSSMLGTTSLGSGDLELYIYVPTQAFSPDIPYSVAYLSVPSAYDAVWATSPYDQAVADVRERVVENAEVIAEKRWEAVRAKAQSELDDARADYERERQDAERELDNASADLDSARSQLDAAAGDLASGRSQLDSSSAQIAASRDRLEQAEAEFQEGKAQLDAQRPAVEQASAQLDMLRMALLDPELPEDQRAAIEGQIAQIEDAAVRFSQAESELSAARAELDAGWDAYNQGLRQYEQGRAEYEQGVAEYREGLGSYESGRAEFDQAQEDAERGFSEAERELADAQAEIDDIERPDIYVIDRSKNAGAASLASDADGIAQIASLFPFMFFIVAALVSLTSMTRMVDEERMVIGTHKALGYGKGRITSKYLIYGALASGVGSIIGVVALGKLLPWFILVSYGVTYAVPVFPTPLEPVTTVKAIGLSVGVCALATWGAAASSLREKPASLMLPRVPKAGKRIFLEHIGPLWRRLSFSHKVTARNLLRYKRRFLMAVVGIAGCTALLMIGFGLRDAIGGIVSAQYRELTTYDAIVRLDDDISDEMRSGVLDAISDSEAEGYLEVAVQAVIARSDSADGVDSGEGDDVRIDLIIPADPGQLERFVVLRNRVDSAVLPLSDDAMVLTEKAATVLGAHAGDTISLYEENLVGDTIGDAHLLRVSGIAENYLGHFGYLMPEGYREMFGEEPDYSIVYVKLAEDADESWFGERMLEVEGVSGVTFTSERIGTYEDMLDVMNKLIYIIVAAAAALAFVVLYNLTNINIGERIREIATLKVLGFTKSEVTAYIFREIIVMALIGAIVGCVLGVPLTFYIAEAAETANMMFGRVIEPGSFILSFLITMAFSVIVAMAMRGKLAEVSMVESLKSVE